MNRFIAIVLGFSAAASLTAAPADYSRDVKPLLAAQCVKCHGKSQQKGQLRLDTAAAAKTGGKHGPAVKPGKGTASLMIQAVEGKHAELPRMPYKRPPLDAPQIALLKRWIDAGAPAPANEQPSDDRHWAFIAPVRPAVPLIRNPQFAIRNSIDSFIRARLEQAKIKPSPEADRYTLIRRLSLDLTGLPPTIAEIDAFVNDRSADAYAKLVDRLLDSPHYGERWGRWWLDVARYADSNGYSIDAPRQIWKYRDWVINAFNRDLPFDQFTIEQLAGDLLPNATAEQKIATGFHRNTQINQEGGIDKEQFRIESVFDRVNTTMTAWQGVTFGCAQCHDHKFDPFTQKDYYRLFAFLNNQDEPTLELPDPSADRSALEMERAEALGDLERYLGTAGGDLDRAEAALSEESRAALKSAVLKALKTPLAKRTLAQTRLLHAELRANDQEFKAKNDRLARAESSKAGMVSTMVLAESAKPRETVMFIKGDFTRRGEPVQSDVPAALPRLVAPPSGKTPNRLDLARWLVSPENPLTARVAMNRIWQQYFGKGLVETENDFGTMGLPPSHPELLDWLATELIRQKWSLKAMHRLIVNSATYQQSSHARPDLALKDPNNKLLARQNRLRLDAEIVRDVMLGASGLLSPKVGGPSVYPPIPDGAMSLGQVKRQWKPAQDSERYRRGMYTFYYRATPHPSLSVFDAPDAFSACTRRIRSNTPLQALTLLNDQACYEFSQALGERVLREGQGSDGERLDLAFRLCLARPPQAKERERLQQLFTQQKTAAADEREAWATLARVLLNLDETITRE
ncbi:MAG TPA: PSD1 and planctomycete cytochrome C domain-containing protein [Verrucomicrobiae bacterium]